MAFRNHSTKRQMRTFAARVKRFRVTHSMTQGQLAKAMGVGKRTVQNVESCDFVPRYSTIIKFNNLEKRYDKRDENRTGSPNWQTEAVGNG